MKIDFFDGKKNQWKKMKNKKFENLNFALKMFDFWMNLMKLTLNLIQFIILLWKFNAKTFKYKI